MTSIFWGGGKKEIPARGPESDLINAYL